MTKPITILALGLTGAPGRYATRAMNGLDATHPGLLRIIHAPGPAEVDRSMLGEVDAMFVQGIHGPADVTAVLALFDACHDGTPLMVSIPCGAELLRRATHTPVPRLTPDEIAHGLLTLAHECDPDAPAPGPFPIRPHGRWHCGEPPHDPVATVGVAVQDHQVAAGETAVIEAVVEGLHARGIETLCWLDDPADLDPAPSMWVNLTGFTLTGSHAESRLDEGTALLSASDAPAVTPILLTRGAEPSSTTTSMAVAVPEFEGATSPWRLCHRDPKSGEQILDRGTIDRLVDRVARTLTLRRTPVAERRVSITIFGHDADGTLGTASHLDVFASVFELLQGLADAGYAVEVPETVDELIDAIVTDRSGGARTEAAVLAEWPARDYLSALRRHTTTAQRRTLEKLFGPAPGQIDADGHSITIRGARFGNVTVCAQPSFGDVVDPVALLYAEDAAPSHAFLAHYLWLHEVEQHHVMLHFGTHGAMEFMPGRDIALTAEDWPVVLTGSVPHAYLYAVNNPAEGSIAKRRSMATLVNYLTPRLDDAGLTEEARRVDEEAERLLERASTSSLVVADLTELDAGLRAGGLDEYLPIPQRSDALVGWLQELRTSLAALARTAIPIGLHTLGHGIHGDQADRIIVQATENHDSGCVRSASSTDWEAELRAALARNDEVPSLMHALDGGYVPPGPGSEPARRPDVLPTGRNTHGVDPSTVPDGMAVARGAHRAEALLAAMEEIPQSITMPLFGMDNVKTHGEGIAQVFRLIGVEPLARPGGAKIDRYRIIGVEELGRPRVDVICTLSGVCRDLFRGPLALLDQAITEVAALDEPNGVNPIAAHARARAEELGLDLATAAGRIFAPAQGRYGTGVNKQVQASRWDDDSDLAEMFLHRMGHLWRDGHTQEHRDLFRANLATSAATFQNVDSAEISLLGTDHYFEFLGGATAAVAKASGQRPQTFVARAWEPGTGVVDLDSEVALESRSRLLNPKWFEGQLAHGYQGVGQIRTRLENTLGMQATTRAVPDWVFDEATRRLISDDDVRERMERHNTTAVASMVGVLLETADRGLWEADEGLLDELEAHAERLDDALEGILE